MRTLCSLFAVTLILGCGQQAPVATRPAAPRQDAPSGHDGHITQLREKLAEFDSQIASWEKKLPRAKDDVQAKLRSRIEELRAERAKFAQLVQRLASADDAGWAMLKDSTDKAAEGLKAMLERTTTEFP